MLPFSVPCHLLLPLILLFNVVLLPNLGGVSNKIMIIGHTYVQQVSERRKPTRAQKKRKKEKKKEKRKSFFLFKKN